MESSFEYFDEVWVGSNFVLDAISRVSPIPVVRIPLALREGTDSVGRGDRSNLGLSAESFVFIFMFDFHSFIARKNPLGLIEAFKMAFSDEDDAWLILKSAHSGTNAADFEAVKAATTGAKIKLIDTILSEGETTALLSTCDCYVSLHRSEGFGLPIAEAMSLGKPVIVTAYSGNMDFTTPSNSLLVKYRLVDLDRDYGPYKKGSVWADPSLDHAADLMRYAYEHRDVGNAMGRRAREDVLQLFHPRVVGRQMHDRLQRVVPRGKDSGKGRHELSSSPVTHTRVVVPPSSEATRAPSEGEMVADMTSLHAEYDIRNTPLTSHRRVVGPAISLTKKILRQLVTPVLKRQVSYNAANTRLVAQLKQQGEALAQQQAEPPDAAPSSRGRLWPSSRGRLWPSSRRRLWPGSRRRLWPSRGRLWPSSRGRLWPSSRRSSGRSSSSKPRLWASSRRRSDNKAMRWASSRRRSSSRVRFWANSKRTSSTTFLVARSARRGPGRHEGPRFKRGAEAPANALSVTGGQQEASPAQVETKRVIRQALDGDFDYFGLEQRFRGSEEQIKDRQRMYIDYFQGQEEVLDIGCGRGEFLELLRERGIKGRGADIDTDMVLLCREKGLDVVKEDAFSCLRACLTSRSAGFSLLR